ncbi:uncharacterized protein LOC135936842 isoform X1 [Cloeon dipterum]|uniref:uncharacterized protein LOC135936842 isoform X1 n=1 Tax=Cloeon dipterum TaxID=197152 RepID=UPI00321FBABF
MASQQYSLRWNNYVRHMTSAFESLRSDKDLIDVTLSCEGKKIPAHKMLLSACSSYFKDLFKENPCQHPVIIFRNVTFVDLVALVDFMYNGEVNVEQEQLASFLNTAELLQVQGLTNSSKDQEKFRKTAKEDDRVPGSSSQFDEDGEERTTTPTRTGPPAAKKRKWQSPSRTESPAALLESQTAQVSSGGDEDLQTIDQVPLKTETPEYDDEDDVQAESGGEDTTDEQDIVQKIQKSDQLVLTSNRNRTSNNEHSLFGNNSMDMDSGDMSSFGMAGPSNESMGQDGMQDISTKCEDYSEDFANNSAGQSEIWQIVHSFSISNDQFEQSIVPKSCHPRRRVYTVFKPADNLTNSPYYVEADAEFTDDDDDDEPLPAEYESLTNIEEIDSESGRSLRSASLNRLGEMQPIVDLGLRLSVNDNELNARDSKPQVADALNGDAEFQRRLEPKSTWQVPQNDMTLKVERKKPGPKPKKGPIDQNSGRKKPGPKANDVTPKIARKKAGAKPKSNQVENVSKPNKKLVRNENKISSQIRNEKCEKKKSDQKSKVDRKTAKANAKQGKDWLWVIERNDQFVCNKCARTFPTRTHCLTHQNKHRMTYCCVKCNRCFISKPRLLRHRLAYHSKSRK